MNTDEVIMVLKMELQKAETDFYPDRRIALRRAIEALRERESGRGDASR